MTTEIRPYDEARDAENARAIALAMLQGMDEILQARADMLTPATWPQRRAELEKKLDAERPALECWPDPDEDEDLEADLDAAAAMLQVAEQTGDRAAIAAATADLNAAQRRLDRNRRAAETHKALFTPRPGAEGFFALVELLGEAGPRRSPVIMRDRRGTAYAAERGAGLSMLERQLFEACAFTAQGAPCLPHEVRHRRAWYADASQIRHRWPSLTADAAEQLAEAFRIVGIGAIADTPAMRKMFAAMDTPAGAKRGYYYFLGLAAELLAVAPEDDAPLVDYVEEEEEEQDDDAPILQAEGYHLLDDPRDDDDNTASVQWLARPANRRTRAVVERIRAAATLPALKAVGKSLFGSGHHRDHTADTVVWAEYHARKAALTPPLSPRAQYVIRRLQEGAPTAIVAAWLHGAGKARLAQSDLAQCWDAWRKAKAKATSLIAKA